MLYYLFFLKKKCYIIDVNQKYNNLYYIVDVIGKNKYDLL